MSLAIFISDVARRDERSRREDVGVLRALRFEMVLGLAKLRCRSVARSSSATIAPNSGMRVEPGADRGAADRQLAQTGQRRLDAVDGVLDLAGVAAELLAEADRHRVHEVRASDLDHVVELVGLLGAASSCSERSAGRSRARSRARPPRAVSSG